MTTLAKEKLWRKLVACLLTTQQRSGPNAPISRFCRQRPFPLSLRVLRGQPDVVAFVHRAITRFGGIRRGELIGREVAENLRWLEHEAGWTEIRRVLRTLSGPASRDVERAAADRLDELLIGFGPKQSRNLLQALGLTRYEIPLDSRVIAWLNEFGFPVTLTSQGLSDRSYYCFVLDGFQLLCKKTGILPCLLDAAIFASKDAGWSSGRLAPV